MPFDPFFQNPGKLIESVEFQLGRSDFLLGLPHQQCPFPPTDTPPDDASEWSRGWQLEKQIEVSIRTVGEKANPTWKRRKPKPSRA